MKRIRDKRHRDAEYFSQMYENVNRSEVFTTRRLRRLYFAWCAPILKAEGCYWSKRIADLLT